MVRRSARWLGPLLVLGVLGAAAALALPAVLGAAVDRVVAASQGTAGWGPARSSLTLTAALVAFLVVEDVVSQLVGGTGTARATGQLRSRLVRHVLGAGPAVAHGAGAGERLAEGDVVARIVGGTQATARVVQLAAGLVGALVPPVGGLVALAVVDPWLAVTFGAGTVLASGAVRTYLRDSRAVNAGYLEAQGTIAARLVDAQAGARTIAAARTTDREVARVLGPLPDLRDHGLGVWRTMARLAFRGEPVVLLTQVAVVAVAGLGLAAGRLTPGEMLAASRYAVMAAGVSGMIGELAGLGRARAGAQRVAAVLGTPVMAYGQRGVPEGPGTLELRGVVAGARGAGAGGAGARGPGSGSRDGVAGGGGAGDGAPDGDARHGAAGGQGRAHDTGTDGPASSGRAGDGTPGRGVPDDAASGRTEAHNGAADGQGGAHDGGTGGTGGPVLRDLDLRVPGGATVALVGRSGSGKSLAAAVAGRLCDPDAGEVLLDGVPLRELSRRSLRRAIAHAFERPVMVGGADGTVAGAIAFGDEPLPPERVGRAAEAARADGFVRRLPDGYAARLAATPMSGGELQRLGLARALARDARVLILDDATSSLDTATEAEIAAALTTAAAGRTRLIVTHRATTAARADLVAWLDGGRIRAFGPHGRLWDDPEYRAVFLPEEPAVTPAPPPPRAPAGAPA